MCQIQGLMEANTSQYVMWIARQAFHGSMVNAWSPSKSPNDRIQTITGTIFFVQLSPNDVVVRLTPASRHNCTNIYVYWYLLTCRAQRNIPTNILTLSRKHTHSTDSMSTQLTTPARCSTHDKKSGTSLSTTFLLEPALNVCLLKQKKKLSMHPSAVIASKVPKWSHPLRHL